jgi:hypothetical protein
MNKPELLKRKTEIEKELADINGQLAKIELNEKPYEAVIIGYASPGRSSMFFKTEEQARKKFEEYSAKSYYRNGRVDGTVLYRHNDDGTKTRLDFVRKPHYWRDPE